MHPGRRECPQQQGPAGIPQALTDHTFKTVPLGEQDLTSGTWFVCDSLTEKEPQFKKFSQYFISQQQGKNRKVPDEQDEWELLDSHHTTSLPALSRACSQLPFPGFGAPGSAAGHW